MQTHFACGKSGVTLELPDGPRYLLAETRSAVPLSDVQGALSNAVERPVAGPGLRELAAGKKTAAIAVCDITRPAPNAVTLPAVLGALAEAGIPRDGVTLLIATGLHRAATDAEIRSILGQEIAAQYRVLNHDARNFAQHARLGETRRGTPVYIDQRFVDADLHITLGLIEPHLMLGFSGGRKLIAPGVAAQETIKVIHSPGFMGEPMATEGQIEQNPLHAELLEIAAMARHDFMLDVTLTPRREIAGIFAGEPVAAHAAGVRFFKQSSLRRLPEPADLVITSAAGYPLDLTFYQTIKGITAAQHIAKPGGRILVIGECGEGIGSPEFARKLEGYPGHKEYLEEICDNRSVVADQWQLQKLALVGLEHEVFFYCPGVEGRQLGSLAKNHFADLKAAVAAATAGLWRDAVVTLIPDGPYTFARVESGVSAA